MDDTIKIFILKVIKHLPVYYTDESSYDIEDIIKDEYQCVIVNGMYIYASRPSSYVILTEGGNPYYPVSYNSLEYFIAEIHLTTAVARFGDMNIVTSLYESTAELTELFEQGLEFNRKDKSYQTDIEERFKTIKEEGSNPKKMLQHYKEFEQHFVYPYYGMSEVVVTKNEYEQKYPKSYFDILSKDEIACNKEAMEKLWNDTSNYGPVVASLIYLGCLVYKIPMLALQKFWIEIKNEIKKIADKHKNDPVKVFNLFVKQNQCYYSANKYNFIVDMYLYGRMNCESYVLLFYTIFHLMKEWYIRENSNWKALAIIETGHIKIMMIRLSPLAFYEVETTKGEQAELERIEGLQRKMQDVFFAIYSEQVMGVYVLINSSSRNLDCRQLLKTVFGNDITKPVKTLIDASAVKMIEFNCKNQSHKYDNGVQLNEEFIVLDIMDVVHNKPASKEELEKRYSYFEE